MKKLIFLASFIGCSVCNVSAQLKVDPNSGNVAIKTTATPLSSLSIGGAGLSNFNVYSKSAKCGIYCTTTGNGDNWGNAGEFYNTGKNNNFIVGVRGEIGPVNGQDLDRGRSFGLFGKAGYATSGWNYGVYGQVVGAHNGAGVYGTTSLSENGTYVDGRYAGYFNGNTKVVGNLFVTGSVSGLVLGLAADRAAETRALSSDAGVVTDKLAGLSAVSFYKSVPSAAKAAVNCGDTIVEERRPCLIESQDMGRQHFALSAEELEEVLPDLVYMNEDGTKSINYVEMIPLLVQSINELKEEINELRGNTSDIRETDAIVIEGLTGKTTEAVLCQNVPNPFTESSYVKLFIPNTAKNAVVYVYDMAGKQIKKLSIGNRGETSFTFRSGELDAGMYIYSLIIDGKLIDTKRMIVAK